MLNYSKGTIVYVVNRSLEGTDINYRPAIVVSEPDGDIFGDVTVVTVTSQIEPGIRFNLKASKGYYYTASTIKPYNLITVKTTDISGTIGYLDRGTMRALDKAIAYHLGFSDETPPYLLPEIGVVYNHVTPVEPLPEELPQESFEEEELFDDCVEENIPPQEETKEGFCDTEQSEVQGNLIESVEEESEDIVNKCPGTLLYDKGEYVIWGCQQE